ncbi:hypothetical protein acdb102_39320 [Acidothermaceae bacterium B102]|nr:hypothetical protein acdb102_39320 [Acidothermaceae bacterium B102]
MLAAGAGAEVAALAPAAVVAAVLPDVAADVGAVAAPLVDEAADGELLDPLQADSTSDAATAITAPEESRLFIRTLPEDVRARSAEDGQQRPRCDFVGIYVS